VIAIVVAITGATLLVVAVRSQRSVPRPPPAAAGRLIEPATTSSSTTSVRTAGSTTTPKGPPQSPPTNVSIPSIGVTSALTSQGLNADGSVHVPDSYSVAGWFNGSVTPGQIGPTVIIGHVDSTAGPGVFFRLGDLRPGDQVTVDRLDGTAFTYKITGVRQYAKDHFPTLDVYGNTPVPTIRLITCGGTFDSATHHYLSNIVAYGQLV
jgi:LPXTG-site transpeptidase (sortase) family protein